MHNNSQSKFIAIISIAIAVLSTGAFAQELPPSKQTPPTEQPKTAPAVKPHVSVLPESVDFISQVTDVGRDDECYRDLQSLIERYGISGLTKDKKFNGAANVTLHDLDLWTANGQIALMSIASRQGIASKKYYPLLGKGCGAPRAETFTEAQVMKVIQCRFIVPALKTTSPEKIATRARFAMMLNQAMDLWVGGLAKAVADIDAANAADAAARAAAKMSFFDTFDNGQKGWAISDNSSAKTSIANSQFLMNLKFDAILISTLPIAKAPKIDPNRDFSIEVSFAFLSGKPTDSFGLVWGASNDQKRRHSCGVLQGGSYYLGKHAGGIWKDEIKISETNFLKKGPNVMNRLIVRKYKNELNLSINTAKAMTVPYVAFEQNGTFGFQLSGESSVAIDYIHVQQD